MFAVDETFPVVGGRTASDLVNNFHDGSGDSADILHKQLELLRGDWDKANTAVGQIADQIIQEVNHWVEATPKLVELPKAMVAEETLRPITHDMLAIVEQRQVLPDIRRLIDQTTGRKEPPPAKESIKSIKVGALMGSGAIGGAYEAKVILRDGTTFDAAIKIPHSRLSSDLLERHTSEAIILDHFTEHQIPYTCWAVPLSGEELTTLGYDKAPNGAILLELAKGRRLTKLMEDHFSSGNESGPVTSGIYLTMAQAADFLSRALQQGYGEKDRKADDLWLTPDGKLTVLDVNVCNVTSGSPLAELLTSIEPYRDSFQRKVLQKEIPDPRFSLSEGAFIYFGRTGVFPSLVSGGLLPPHVDEIKRLEFREAVNRLPMALRVVCLSLTLQDDYADSSVDGYFPNNKFDRLAPFEAYVNYFGLCHLLKSATSQSKVDSVLAEARKLFPGLPWELIASELNPTFCVFDFNQKAQQQSKFDAKLDAYLRGGAEYERRQFLAQEKLLSIKTDELIRLFKPADREQALTRKTDAEWFDTFMDFCKNFIQNLRIQAPINQDPIGFTDIFLNEDAFNARLNNITFLTDTQKRGIKAAYLFARGFTNYLQLYIGVMDERGWPSLRDTLMSRVEGYEIDFATTVYNKLLLLEPLSETEIQLLTHIMEGANKRDFPTSTSFGFNHSRHGDFSISFRSKVAVEDFSRVLKYSGYGDFNDLVVADYPSLSVDPAVIDHAEVLYKQVRSKLTNQDPAHWRHIAGLSLAGSIMLEGFNDEIVEETVSALGYCRSAGQLTERLCLLAQTVGREGERIGGDRIGQIVISLNQMGDGVFAKFAELINAKRAEMIAGTRLMRGYAIASGIAGETSDDFATAHEDAENFVIPDILEEKQVLAEKMYQKISASSDVDQATAEHFRTLCEAIRADIEAHAGDFLLTNYGARIPDEVEDEDLIDDAREEFDSFRNALTQPIQHLFDLVKSLRN